MRGIWVAGAAPLVVRSGRVSGAVGRARHSPAATVEAAGEPFLLTPVCPATSCRVQADDERGRWPIDPPAAVPVSARAEEPGTGGARNKNQLDIALGARRC